MPSTNSEANISILMPIYNGSKYLPESIGSIIAQTFTNWELIALDDGSSDNSYEILKQLAQKEPRIRIYLRRTTPRATWHATLRSCVNGQKANMPFICRKTTPCRPTVWKDSINVPQRLMQTSYCQICYCDMRTIVLEHGRAPIRLIKTTN